MRHTSVCRSKNPANNYEQFTFKKCIGSTFEPLYVCIYSSSMSDVFAYKVHVSHIVGVGM